MPRPKRTKVAPSAPAPRLRQPIKKPQRQEEESIVVAIPDIAEAARKDDLYDISDPDEGLVTNARRVKRRSTTSGRGKGKEVARAGTDEIEGEEGGDGDGTSNTAAGNTQDFHMSGALFDDIDLESSMEMSRREDHVNTPASRRVSLANFRRRQRQPSILGRGGARGRSSSVESNLAQDNLMSVGRKGASAIRGRQRAGSMSRFGVASSMALDLDRGTTPVRTASVLNLGNFKRRQREPSILGTAQKRREEEDERRFEIGNDDLEGFEPDGESTPLNFEKTRKSGGVESTTPVAGSSSSKKRKRSLVDEDIEVPQSSGNVVTPSAPQASEQIPMTLSSDHSEQEDEEESENESEPSGGEDNELPMPSIERAESEEEVTPEPPSETMAPPRSSSSQPSSPLSPALPPPRAARPASSRGRQLRGRTPQPRTQDSPISSPPSLTHSPNRIGTRAGRQQSQKPIPIPSTFSTAQLQTLMPQRRRRARARGRGGDPFDVPSSDGEAEIDTTELADSDDELSHIQVRARPRRVNALSSSTTARTKKSSTIKPNKIPLKQATSKRTYGLKSTSDKENAEGNEGEEDVDVEAEVEEGDSLAPLPDSDMASEDSQQLEARVGRELKIAARKFQEVDRWELDFEDVSASSESWRERDAR